MTSIDSFNLLSKKYGNDACYVHCPKFDAFVRKNCERRGLEKNRYWCCKTNFKNKVNDKNLILIRRLVAMRATVK